MIKRKKFIHAALAVTGTALTAAVCYAQFVPEQASGLATGLESGVRGSIADASVKEGTTISLQKKGQVIRSTSPVRSANLQANGSFVFPAVQEGTYDLVVSAPGFITKVVTGIVVPKSGVLNLDPDPATDVDENEIELVPATVQGQAKGTVCSTDKSKLGTLVDITQTLSGGGTVLIASSPLVFESLDVKGKYSFILPVDAPEVAPYVVNKTFNFAIETGIEGQYTVVARSGSLNEVPLQPRTAPLNFNPGFVTTEGKLREVVSHDFDCASVRAPK